MSKRQRTRAATHGERRRASVLHARVRAGETISKRDAKWLAGYARARKAHAAKREAKRKGPPRVESALAQAKIIALWAARYVVSSDVDVEDEFAFTGAWVRKSRPGKPGIARAGVEWETPTLPDEDTIPSPMPQKANRGSRLANVRVLVAYLDEDGRVVDRQWTSLQALTRSWQKIRGDVRTALRGLGERPSIRARRAGSSDFSIDLAVGAIAVSVQVSP